jgi:predicted aspartyl protease
MLFFAVFTYCVLSCSVANANSFSLTSSSGGTLYLQSFDADEREFNYLIDTGSSLTILNKATFKVFAAQQHVTEEGVVIAKLANGRKQKVKLYTIPSLALSADCHFDNVKVAVMDNQHNILGMEVLGRAAPFGIQMSPPTLTLHQCDDEIGSELLAKSPAEPVL